MTNVFSKGIIASIFISAFVTIYSKAQTGNENLTKPDPKFSWSYRTVTEVYFDAEEKVKALKNSDTGPEIDELKKVKLPAKQYSNTKPYNQLFSSALLSGKYKAYHPTNNKLLSSKEVKDIILRVDTEIIQDVKTGGWDTNYVKTNIGEKITKYRVITDWFYDAYQNKMEAKVVGLEPMIAEINRATGDFIGWKPLFWFYLE